MLITRETDYALRILRALAPGSCLTVGEIAEKESLPHKFTYKIMKKLEKAGIIRIIRGVNGGCQPVSYTHLDVYKRQKQPCQ